MKIATWNVNSINARLQHLIQWLKDFQPDVALLQETKCVDENFPRLELEELGYHLAFHGQKSYNGVAILSKAAISDVVTTLPGYEVGAARYIQASIENGPNVIRVISAYVPNGQSLDSEKFQEKIQFFKCLQQHSQALMEDERPLIIGGDYNVAFDEGDVYDVSKYQNRLHFSIPERQALRALTHIGFSDAVRLQHPAGHMYSWWDYRAGSWQQDKGLRIDHLLLSPQATDLLKDAGIDRTPRGWEKPSDHTPVWCELMAA